MNIKQTLRDSFQKDLSLNVPNLKRKGEVWQATITHGITFEVFFEFSNPKLIPNTLTIHCRVYASGSDLTKDITDERLKHKNNWDTIKFPYSIHHQLFEIPEAMWYKKKVGYAYWLLLMQQKKIHINNDEQINYAKKELFPYGAKEVRRIYERYKKKY